MSLVDVEISSGVMNNALIFLGRAIDELTSHEDRNDSELTIDVAVMSVTLMQISFELIAVSYLVGRHGVRHVMRKRDRGKTDAEILQMFRRGELNTATGSELLELIGEEDIFGDDEIESISTFQNIRNKLIHLSYVMSGGDRYDFKYDLVHYIVHVIVKSVHKNDDVFSDPRVVEGVVGSASYEKLISFPAYISKMESLLRSGGHDVLRCPHCGRRTYSADDEICFVCLWSIEVYERASCGKCGAGRSVVFDSLNIDQNDHMVRGLCLKCDEDDVVYKCPKCGGVQCLEAPAEDEYCTPDHCVWRE